MKHDGWSKARHISHYYAAHKGENITDPWRKLHFVDMAQAAYGDWKLYVDDDGNYWEEFFSIGD